MFMYSIVGHPGSYNRVPDVGYNLCVSDNCVLDLVIYLFVFMMGNLLTNTVGVFPIL